MTQDRQAMADLALLSIPVMELSSHRQAPPKTTFVSFGRTGSSHAYGVCTIPGVVPALGAVTDDVPMLCPAALRARTSTCRGEDGNVISVWKPVLAALATGASAPAEDPASTFQVVVWVDPFQLA